MVTFPRNLARMGWRCTVAVSLPPIAGLSTGRVDVIAYFATRPVGRRRTCADAVVDTCGPHASSTADEQQPIVVAGQRRARRWRSRPSIQIAVAHGHHRAGELGVPGAAEASSQ
jgi:hypothetical protein